MSTPAGRTVVSFDWALKNILRDKANYDILEGFLSTLLRQNITVVSILESEANQRHETDKFNRVDLIVADEDQALFVVEIQNSRERHYLQRLLYGSSKLIVDHVHLGDDYDKVRKVISISILYFLLGEGETDYLYHGKTEFYGWHSHQPLKLRAEKQKAVVGTEIVVNGQQKNIFPEYYLLEVERFPDEVKSDIDEWIYFFKHSKILDDFHSKNIQSARRKLDLLKMPEQERRIYERYVMNKVSERDMIQTAREEGLEEGRTEGRTEGIKAGKLEVARQMLAKGMDIALISEITGLTDAEIRITQL